VKLVETHETSAMPLPKWGSRVRIPSSALQKLQAYEIPWWVLALSESVRNRPEVTPKRLSRRAADL
jgi:hypothetical protein